VPVTDRPRTYLAVTPEAEWSVKQRLAEAGLEDRQIALIHPATAFQTKQWATENFARVAESLAERGFASVAIGAPNERETLESLVAEAGIRFGFVNLQTLHTTTAIAVNECEPLLLSDFAALLEHAAPRDAAYQHDDMTSRTVNVTPDERINGHAHCRALLLGPSACLNVIDGKLLLGRWQRVFMAELDGPRTREVSVLVLGEGPR